MHFRIVHDFDLDPDELWKLYFDDGFNIEMYRTLDVAKREVLEMHEDEHTVRRLQRVTPRRRVPGFIHRILPDQTYVQCDTLHRQQSQMDVVVEPKLLRDRCHIQGVCTVTPLGEGRCRRVFEGDAEIAVPVIGGQLEKVLVGNIQSAYDIGSLITNRYIESQIPATPARRDDRRL